jgi:hypothetical protein
MLMLAASAHCVHPDAKYFAQANRFNFLAPQLGIGSMV